MNAALQLVGVIDMQRPAAVEGDVIGDVHQRVDGPEADGAQALLQPVGRRAVLHAPDQAAGKDRAGIGRRRVETQRDLDRAGEFAFAGKAFVFLLQLAEAQRRKVARDAAHAQAVRPVRRHRNVEHRIADAHHIHIALADVLAGALRQFDDAAMLVRRAAIRAPSTACPSNSTPRILALPRVKSVPGI